MNDSKYDVIVIGAGPAGLIWLQEALKNHKKTLLIDQGAFLDANYSSIGTSWISDQKIHLGGIGGTANAWQGQCVLLDAKQFNEIFNVQDTEAYQAYLEASKSLAKNLSIDFNHRLKKLISRAKSELNLPDNVKVRFSNMPIIQDWKQIFKSALKSKSFDYVNLRVESIESTEDYISSILLSNNQEISLDKETQVVLATNSIDTALLLSSVGFSELDNKTQQKVKVYDHPWRTKYRYLSNGNKFARRKIFSYHIGINFRMKTKYKFEVSIDDIAIGVFELRPEFRGSTVSKIVARGSQKILGFSIINPTYVDVFCQIAQSHPIEFPNSGVLEDSLDDKDYERMHMLEEISKDVLIKSGYALIENHEDSMINQAFHTTGTIDFSSEGVLPYIEFPGVSRDFENLYISGGAGLGNCSWVNPTFTIMALATLNAKRAFKTS